MPWQTRDRLKEAIVKLGPKLDEAVTRLNKGESKQKVGKAIGVHPRWLSDLNPILKLPPALTGEEPEPDEPLVKGPDARSTMTTARRLIDSRMPLQSRINRLVKLARSKNENVAARALERLDDLGGIIPSKTPVEPDPPPLFKLSDHSMPTLERYDEWIKTKRAEADAASTPIPPNATRIVH